MKTYPVERNGKTMMVTVPEDAWEALLAVLDAADGVLANLDANGGECEWEVADELHHAINNANAALDAS